ncbi:cellulase family glycosylhydrolase [Micromonospora sp. M12]
MRTSRLVTTLAVAGLLAGGVAMTATPASAATAVFSVTNNWGSGYQGQVTVTNDTSTPITSWRVEFDLPSSTSVSQSWNAQQTTSGSHYTFTNVSWNGRCRRRLDLVRLPGQRLRHPAQLHGERRLLRRRAAAHDPTTDDSASHHPASDHRHAGRAARATAGLRHNDVRQVRRSGAVAGISSMWLNWETAPYAENLSALTWMRDNWNLQVIRAAMGVEPAGAYLSDPNKARAQVETIINNAVSAGVYVIVDWHAHEAQNNQSQAVAFFGDLARRYGNLPNVIWEPYNEPLQVSWTNVIKPYHQAVVSAIRAADPDNIVVLGTPTWSQDVDAAAASPVAGTNLMYTLHFYSCTHGASLRAKGDAAIRAGLALFVTEWGASNADGGLDGRSCLPEAQSWIDWMKANGISWTAWKLDVGTDTTNLLSPGAPVTGGWNNYLHGHAPFVVANMR